MTRVFRRGTQVIVRAEGSLSISEIIANREAAIAAAGQAQSDRVQTGLDRIATGEDRGIATVQATMAVAARDAAVAAAGEAADSASTATTQAGIATTQAGIATTQAGIATTQAGNAASSASDAAASRDQTAILADAAGWASGTALPSLPDAEYPAGAYFLLRIGSGTQLYEVNPAADDWDFVQWVGEILFDDIASVKAWNPPSYPPAGTIIRERQFGYGWSVDSVVVVDPDLLTTGATNSVRLSALPDKDGSVHVFQFGVDTELTNNAPMIQRAWDRYSWVKHPNTGPMFITEPLYIRQSNLRLSGVAPQGGGLSGPSARIVKTTDTAGTGSNVFNGVTDSYAVNAVVIATHDDNSFRSNVCIEFLAFNAADFNVDYNLYAPRAALWTMDNVALNRGKTGWYTFSAWMQDWRSVRYHGFTITAAAAAAGVGAESGWTTQSRGFVWASDGSGGGAGPGNTFKNCWARNCHIAYDIFGMSYGEFQGCGADQISTTAWKIESSHIVMSGCAMENVYAGSWMFQVIGSNSLVLMNGFKTDGRMYGSSVGTTAMLRIQDGAKVVMDACRLQNFSTPASTFNMSIVGGSRLIAENTDFPTNGNGFISYGGGSSWVNTANGITQWRNATRTLSSENIPTGPALVLPGGADRQQIRRLNKSVVSAGSPIITLEQSATGSLFSNCWLDVDVRWWDTAYPDGLGLSKFTVLCRRRSGDRYDQNVTIYHEVRSGADLTGFPAFSIARSGDVWTVTMTPANGDLLVDMDILVSQRATSSAVTPMTVLAP